VVDPPSLQGTEAVQCLLSELVKLVGTANGSAPPWQPPPPNPPPLDANAMKRISQQVHIHAPLAIALLQE